MLEYLLVTTLAIVRASANSALNTAGLGKRLEKLNTRRGAALRLDTSPNASMLGDRTRAELIHYLGLVAEMKVRSRI